MQESVGWCGVGRQGCREDGRYWVVKERGDVQVEMGVFVGTETGGVEDWVVV